jgi:hypothetical protein
MMEGTNEMNKNNKEHLQLSHYSVNLVKENMVWVVQVGLPVVINSFGDQVMEMVCVNGCWEYEEASNR